MAPISSSQNMKIKHERAKDQQILAQLELNNKKFKGLNNTNKSKLPSSKTRTPIRVKLEIDHGAVTEPTSQSLFVLQKPLNFSNNDNAATSTPNDKIKESTDVPELLHKGNFLSKFFLQEPELTPTLEDSQSPCRNVKQVKKQHDSKRVDEQNLLNKQKLKDKKPVQYPVFGDALTESFQEEDLSKLMNKQIPESEVADFFKIAQTSFDDWAKQGLQIHENYQLIIKKLIIARIIFSSKVNNLKKQVDDYGLLLQDKKIKLEEKSFNLQKSGRKFVEEAKSF